MSLAPLLHGGCQCGRNIYIVQFPKQETISSTTTPSFNQAARLLFNQRHNLTPLLRIPLSYYSALTLPIRPDESHSLIHRAYTPPHQPHAMHHFCGYCGTPLSFYSSTPQEEKDFIQLTLGSMWETDLGELDKLGLVPSATTPGDIDAEEQEEGHKVEVKKGSDWLDGLIEGSRLGRLKRREMRRVVKEGRGVRVEYEISEWVDGEELEGEEQERKGGKRKFELALEEEFGGGGSGGGRREGMEGVQPH
ncbi:hypothetical protein B0T21DRAFT_28606 [Apiosordaria backusii]|uniref:CENP-V/GFA domain-containing protein n=1 Tax=Apiosordaria backusii TaxID=314023 RepID=A0AA40K804_9PEZI|nr:hypothetical protein B0T21DRAFT_28606 [Apiosordaria backusii]